MACDNPQRIEDGMSSRLFFQDEEIPFSRSAGVDHTAPRKSGAVSGVSIDGDQNRFGRPPYESRNPSWNLDGGSHSERSNGEEEEYDDDDDEDEDLDEGDGLVSINVNNNVRNGNHSSGSVQSSSENVNGEKARNLNEHHSSFGLSRGMMVKDGNLRGKQQHQHERVGDYENAITIVQPELYSAQVMNGGDCSGSAPKEMGEENGYGFDGRKEVGSSINPEESFRTHFLDPVT